MGMEARWKADRSDMKKSMPDRERHAKRQLKVQQKETHTLQRQESQTKHGLKAHPMAGLKRYVKKEAEEAKQAVHKVHDEEKADKEKQQTHEKLHKKQAEAQAVIDKGRALMK